MELRHWKIILLSAWDRTLTSFWLIPSLMSAGAAVAALVLIEIDQRVDVYRGDELLVPLTEGTAEGARAILSVLAGSMITVTGVVFSITVVALTLASSQFGPRLLRNFMRDRGTQLVLGTFLATFLFSLLVLRSVEGGGDTGFVPRIALTGAIGLSVVSLFVLIYYIHHAASSIQASNIIAAVNAEIEEQMVCLFPEREGKPATPPEHEREAWSREVREAGVSIRSDVSGYVRMVGVAGLVERAQERNHRIRIEKRPGDFVPREGTLGFLHAIDGEASVQDIRNFREAFVIGDHRTAVQDFRFLIDQLTEMAVRALSPGTNDPRTAVACVHRIGATLAALGRREMPSGSRLDASGTLRLVAPATRFEDIARYAIDPIRRYGSADSEVARALIAALADAREQNERPEQRQLLSELAEDVLLATESQSRSKRDYEQVAADYERAFRDD